MWVRLLYTAVLPSVLLGLVFAQSLPAPAEVSRSYISRLLVEYGAEGSGWVTPASLQQLLDRLGVSRHRASGRGHQHGHADHEHSQRVPADHESGLEHRDGGGGGGNQGAQPARANSGLAAGAVDVSGMELLQGQHLQHTLSHDHRSKHDHLGRDGVRGPQRGHPDHDHHDSHNHDHGQDDGSHHHGTDRDPEPSTRYAPVEKQRSRDGREASIQDASPTDASAIDFAPRCPDAGELLFQFGLPPAGRLSGDRLALLCPALVYHAAAKSCPEPGPEPGADDPHQPPPVADAAPPPKLWLFAGLSVLVISLCGLAGVAVVPIMQRVVYRQLLQFLVALAVGTLAGDALLHLLPHALAPHPAHGPGHAHGVEGTADHAHEAEGPAGHAHGAEGPAGHAHLDAVLKGLVALGSLVFFFAAERGIGILHGTCKRSKHKKINKRLAGMPSLSREQTELIEKKINSYRNSAGANHCFGDRDTLDVLARLNTSHEHDSCPAEDSDPADADNHNHQTAPDGSRPRSTDGDQRNAQQSAAEAEPGPSAGRPAARTDDTCARFDAEQPVAHSSDFTVIIHEHEHRHHGHTHTHGHIHEPPAGSAAAVAGMVIVGDGLHNLTDGMAIGAAFAAGVASGLSTSVAVFCHELPHEIGDFAVLLQSGMSVRQALFYNVVSSVLCLLGMVLGLVLGNMAAFSGWVFAAAAGSFLYIALVDMVPELTAGSGNSGSSPCGQLALQLAGMTCGAAIMLVIAVYENDLHSLITL